MDLQNSRAESGYFYIFYISIFYIEELFPYFCKTKALSWLQLSTAA